MTIQTQVSGQANSFRTTPAKCATSSSADLAPKKLDHYLYFVRPCWDYIRSALCLTWEAHQVGRCSWSVAHEKSYCKGSLYEITLQAMPTPKLLDQVRTVIRVRHFSLSTERAYVSWIRRFILFHNKRHPMRWRKQKFASSFLILLSMQKSQHLRKRSRLALSFFFTVTCSSPSGAVPPIYEQIPRPFVLKVQC